MGRLLLSCVALLLSATACDSTTKVTPTSASASAKPSGDSCTPHFTPYTPEAGSCSADHTICSETPRGKRCHGGAIIIPCGESGERCGKTFFCDCRKPGAKKKQ
jgi:hypothetical protein